MWFQHAIIFVTAKVQDSAWFIACFDRRIFCMAYCMFLAVYAAATWLVDFFNCERRFCWEDFKSEETVPAERRYFCLMIIRMHLTFKLKET